MRARTVALSVAVAVIAAAAVGIIRLSPAESPKGKEGAGMNAKPAANKVRQCVGRFCLDVPADARRWADTFSIQGVELEEVAWPEKVDDPWNVVWRDTLTEIEALKTQRSHADDPRGEIVEQRVFKPNVLKGAYVFRDDNRSIGTWQTVLDAQGGGLKLRINTGLSFKEECAARILRVGEAYKRFAPGTELPVEGRDWFYLREGAVAVPFLLKESAHARFDLAAPLKVSIELETESIKREDKPGLMERFAAALEKSGAAALFGSSMPIRSGKRKAAGLEGEEMILRATEGKRVTLNFMWTFTGKARSGTEPEIKIAMDTSADDQDAKLALWDELLESLQPAR